LLNPNHALLENTALGRVVGSLLAIIWVTRHHASKTSLNCFLAGPPNYDKLETMQLP